MMSTYKLIAVAIVLGMLPTLLMGQEASWLDAAESQVVAPIEDTIEPPAELEGGDNIPAPQMVDKATFDSSFLDVQAEIDALRKLADELKRESQKLRDDANRQREGVTKMSADWLDDAEKIAALEADFRDLADGQQGLVAAIEDLKKHKCTCGPHLTEARVREIVQEELKAVVTIQNASGAKVERAVSMRHTGTEIVINPGERLIEIDGVPVERAATSTPMAYTPSYVVTAPAVVNRAAPVPVRVTPRRPVMNALQQASPFSRLLPMKSQPTCSDRNGNGICDIYED